MNPLTEKYPARLLLRHSATGRLVPFVLRPAFVDAAGLGVAAWYGPCDSVTDADYAALGMTPGTMLDARTAVREYAHGPATLLDTVTAQADREERPDLLPFRWPVLRRALVASRRIRVAR